MSRADPCPFARLRDTIGTGAPRRRVIPPAVRFVPAPGVDPPCRSENRAHRCGVAIGIAGCCRPRRPDAQTRAQYGGLTTVERRMAPDQRPVTAALGGFESGIDDFEQVRHRPTGLGPGRAFGAPRSGTVASLPRHEPSVERAAHNTCAAPSPPPDLGSIQRAAIGSRPFAHPSESSVEQFTAPSGAISTTAT